MGSDDLKDQKTRRPEDQKTFSVSVSARARKKEAGMIMGFLTPTLTPALFSAPQVGLEPTTL